VGLGNVGLAGIVLILVLFVGVGLVLYFIVTAILFMKKKRQTDEELVRKIDTLMNRKHQE